MKSVKAQLKSEIWLLVSSAIQDGVSDMIWYRIIEGIRVDFWPRGQLQLSEELFYETN